MTGMTDTAGTILRRTLDTLGITQAELAHHTGLSTKHINQIIGGYTGISPPVAVAIGEATGIPAEIWAMLDAVHSVRQITTAPGHEPKTPIPIGSSARRDTCPSCGRRIRLRSDGKLRRHGVTAGRPDGCDGSETIVETKDPQ